MAQPSQSPDDQTLDPPTSVGGILKQLGPGLIIAGSIVGSGELIATTAVGAEAGFTLLWLIIIGCVIKVFVQVEFGRYAITNAKTTMDGLNEVPGPRLPTANQKRVNWVCWAWLIFIVVALAQLGGIIGGVGQALAIQAPITEAGEFTNRQETLRTRDAVFVARAERLLKEGLKDEQFVEAFSQFRAEVEAFRRDHGVRTFDAIKSNHDPLIWACIITASSIVILIVGRYRLIQNFSTVLVALFTFITIGNLIHLQSLPEWRVNWDDFVAGMSFQIPAGDGLATALAAFGIIGVGATELIQYPYWCLEKGYAKWTGPRPTQEGPEMEAWAERAAGWVRVLKWDAWASMVVYTFATVAFYLLGAAILGRSGLNPAGDQMVRTLGEMYVPVFGDWAQVVFLFGAFAVLYSTFFVATASHARVLADALRVFGVSKGGERAYTFWVKVFCGTLPLLFLACYAFFKAPKQLVLAGGFMGALMLPLLGVSALYFRYRRCDARLRPGKVWDLFLWFSVLGLFIAGQYAFYAKVIQPLMGD